VPKEELNFTGKGNEERENSSVDVGKEWTDFLHPL